MKQDAIKNMAVLSGSALLLGASSATAGEPAPYIPPPPMPAPAECGSPGWTLTAAALYLKSYRADDFSWAGEGYEYDGDWDWGFRGSLDYERPDGLFFRIVGFWYDAGFDYNYEGSSFNNGDFESKADGDMELWDIDFLIGDTFCPTEHTSIELSAGLRYANADEEITEEYDFQEIYTRREKWGRDFDGWGPTIQIRARRTLTDRVALYADLQQSLLFGETDDTLDRTEINNETGDEFDVPDEDRSSDTMAAVTEIRGGVEFLWGFNAIQNAYLRLGAEGQYWWLNSFDVGLVGAVAEVGFTF